MAELPKSPEIEGMERIPETHVSLSIFHEQGLIGLLFHRPLDFLPMTAVEARDLGHAMIEAAAVLARGGESRDSAVTCPSCDGGRLAAEVVVLRSKDPCALCEGVGYVSAALGRHFEDAERLRIACLRSGETIEERSARTGIAPVWFDAGPGEARA